MKRRTVLFITFLCFIFTAQAQLKTISYADGGQKLYGQLRMPINPGKSGKRGVLILPAWMGIDAHSKEVARKFGTMDYTAFVADIYGEGNYPQSAREAGERSGYYKSHIEEYQRRIQLALDQLVKAGVDADKIVVIGYCFGGLGAIEAARTNMRVKGIVSFHGSYGRDSLREIKPIQPKILILHGADDPYSSPAVISSMQQEFRKAGADWQMNYYANAVHAFTERSAGNDNSKGTAYNEEADKRSWQAMLQFLNEVL